jgi:ATP-dependent RNA helicase DeaD
MKKFKSGYISLLICTDVAARGIDVNNLTHVINFGFPQDMESYVHRIGRTGRAGTKGKAYTLVDPNQSGKLRYLERFVKARLEPAKLPTVAKLKVALVDKELARMATLVETVKEKGDEFKLDETYDHFKESLEGLSRDEILKVLFSQKFRKDLRRYQDLGELDAKQGERKEKSFSGGGGRNGRSSADRNARRGPRRGAGAGSERSSSRGSGATKSADSSRKRRTPRV